MPELIAKFADYGVGGLSVSILLGYFVLEIKDMKKQQREDTKWKMQVIENDTLATIGSTNAQNASTAAIQGLARAVENMEKTLERRLP